MKGVYTKLFKDGKTLPLIEDFYTLQGEGFHTGKSAYFIRIGGCDIGCSWCDSKISWNPQEYQAIDAAVIAERASFYPAKALVVTGGEPTLYNLDILCNLVKMQGVKTFLETSGAYKLTGVWDWICLSPKKNKPPLTPILQQAHELKVIIESTNDFEWAEKYANLVNPNCCLYLQPEWSRCKQLLPTMVEYVKANPKWGISLQTHKYMNIP